GLSGWVMRISWPSRWRVSTSSFFLVTSTGYTGSRALRLPSNRPQSCPTLDPMKMVWVIGVLAACAVAQENAVGRKVFESQCALCHGQTGGGGRGPSLNRPKLDRAPTDETLRSLITDGYGDMPGAW